MSREELIQEARLFEETFKSFKTRNEKIMASRKVKELILSINQFYKENKDQNLMDIMKRLTVLKKKVETRLKAR